MHVCVCVCLYVRTPLHPPTHPPPKTQVGHEHDVPIPQTGGAVVVLVGLLQPEDRLQVLDLLVLHDLLVVGVARV